MKKGYTTIIISFLIAILAIISTTFAWMTENQIAEGKWLVLKYGDGDDEKLMYVVDKDVSLEIKMQNKATEEYERIDDLDELFTRDLVVPGEPVLFQIVMTNNTEVTIPVDIDFVNQTASRDDLFDMIYVCLQSYSGYADEFSDKPTLQFCSLGESKVLNAITSKYTSNIIKSVYLPAGYTITLNCYILLSRTADNSFQNENISLGNIRLKIR